MSSDAPVDAVIVDAVAGIRARIADAAARAGRDPAEITLVAATKTVPVERVAAVVAAGVVDIGENRAQELTAKAPALEGTRARWHFLGQLQRNKVRAIAPWVVYWQSVDREELGAEIARRAPGARVLVEVNLAGDDESKRALGLQTTTPAAGSPACTSCVPTSSWRSSRWG